MHASRPGALARRAPGRVSHMRVSAGVTSIVASDANAVAAVSVATSDVTDVAAVATTGGTDVAVGLAAIADAT